MKILAEIVWCVVLYFGACMVTGGVAGAIVGSRCPDAETASRMGAQAAAQVVADNRIYLAGGAMVLTAVGTCLGILPGTREK